MIILHVTQFCPSFISIHADEINQSAGHLTWKMDRL